MSRFGEALSSRNLAKLEGVDLEAVDWEGDLIGAETEFIS